MGQRKQWEEKAREESEEVKVLDEESNEVTSNTTPEKINVKDEAKRQPHCVRTQSKAEKGELVFQRIG